MLLVLGRWVVGRAAKPQRLRPPVAPCACRRAGDFKREVGAFMERWVYGRGVPHITASFRYNRRRSLLQVGMRQAGGAAAKQAADKAERVAQHEGIGTGVIKVAVREGSGVTVEHPVHAGGLPAV